MNWNRSRWKAAHRLWRLVDNGEYHPGRRPIPLLQAFYAIEPSFAADPLLHPSVGSRLWKIRNWQLEKASRLIEPATWPDGMAAGQAVRDALYRINPEPAFWLAGLSDNRS